MTRLEAWKEACRRWPGKAIIRDDSGWSPALGSHRVGYYESGGVRIVGYGATWESAFADADRKAQGGGPDTHSGDRTA